MSGEPCGCVLDEQTGIRVSTCPAHDTRTSRVKVAAALAQLANELDQAGRTITLAQVADCGKALRRAGKAALDASKAVLAP